MAEAEHLPQGSSRTAKVMALSLGSVLSTLAGIVYAMVASRVLSKHDYATVRQTFLAYEFAAPLLMLGLPNAVYYFLPREQTSKRGVVIDNIFLLVLFGLVFSLFIGFGGYRLLAMRFENPDLLQTLKWMIPYPLFIMPIAGLAAVMVCADRTKVLAIYNVVSSLVLATGSIIAVWFSRSYVGPILVRIIIPAVFLPVALWLMYHHTKGPLRIPRLGSMQEMLKYSVPLGLASVLGGITLQMHSVIVAAMVPPEDFAVYINGAMELPLVGIITGSITTVVFAEMSEMCSKGDKQAALQLFHKASIRAATILFPMMCFLLATAVPFIAFLYSDKYHASVWPFIVYLFALPVRIVVYGAALMALGLNRIILFRSVVDLIVNSALCVILVRIFGYIGAAIAMLFTLYLWTIPFNLKKITEGFGVAWSLGLPFRELGKILLISLIFSPLAYLGVVLWRWNNIGRLFSASVLYWPLLFYTLHRMGALIVPAFIERYIPCALRGKK